MSLDIFTRHPASVGESYGEHMRVSAGFGFRLLKASLACFVHALFPFFFERTGSTAIHSLHGQMVVSRLQRDERMRDGVPAC